MRAELTLGISQVNL